MAKQISLDTLWESAIAKEQCFNPDQIAQLPEAVRRYLQHAIAPGTQLAAAVRLHMHGEIKLKGWVPFKAQQVISEANGMIWSATAWMNGLPVFGSDRFLDGQGTMQWKILGIFPVMVASGLDISRSTRGRLRAESVWLPSLLCGKDVVWQATDPSHINPNFVIQGERAQLDLTIDTKGRLHTAKLMRWGNPDNTTFHDVEFGAIVEEEQTFCGYTIPSYLRVGWYFGTDQFESKGEFFRVTIDDAIFR